MAVIDVAVNIIEQVNDSISEEMSLAEMMLDLDEEITASRNWAPLKSIVLGFLYSFMHINGTYRLSFCVEQLGYATVWYEDLIASGSDIELDSIKRDVGTFTANLYKFASLFNSCVESAVDFSKVWQWANFLFANPSRILAQIWTNNLKVVSAVVGFYLSVT